MMKPTRQPEIKREWHLVDAREEILGRLASRITPLLLGKRKPCFVSHLDCGDHVVVINAREVKVTGRKETRKIYTSYSGYPGGLRVMTLARLREKFPERIIERAVYNMLPKNKLRNEFMKRLYIFAGEEHPYKEKFNRVAKEKQ